jgi:Skp family chaperone for outer membrane proteins
MKPINIEILMGHSTAINNESDKLRAEFKNIQALNNREQLNTDAITALSDQVMRLTIELERMKNHHEIAFASS